MWKEKQAQVIKEELRVKETIAKMAAESKASTKAISKQHTTSTVIEVKCLDFFVLYPNCII